MAAGSVDPHGFAVGSIGIAAVGLFHDALKDGAEKGNTTGGLLVASTFTLALGAASSAILRDWRPFGFAVLIAIAFGGAFKLVEGAQPRG